MYYNNSFLYPTFKISTKLLNIPDTKKLYKGSTYFYFIID